MHKFQESDGSFSDVQRERWEWEIQYSDGSIFKQFGDDGIFHRIGEIDQDRIVLATLRKAEDSFQCVHIPWREGMRLVHKYVNFKSEHTDKWNRIYVFGYKYDGQHSFQFILPDDRIICSPVSEGLDFSLFV